MARKNSAACVHQTRGHALFCKIAKEERAKTLAASLMTEQLFSGWGIRTVGAGESRYNPMSYHNGSVWPHDNALIGMGFSLYGYPQKSCEILHALFEVSRDVELQRLPELFCGFHKRPGTSGPTLYPVACCAASMGRRRRLPFAACLPRYVRTRAERQICFAHPLLPANLDEVRIENLRVVDATVDLLMRRQEDGVDVEVLRRRGEIEIVKSL